MKQPNISFREVIATLEEFHGSPAPAFPTDPWEQVLWENVAYLTTDKKRSSAFNLLRQTVGFEPEQILSASETALEAVTSHGPMAELFAGKLRECARILLDEFGGSLDDLAEMTPSKAKKALRQFPGIGEPGAEKILLYAGIQPTIAFDSNGLRVMIRLGFGEESSNYSATYRSAQTAVSSEIGLDINRLIASYQLLRKHGQAICKRNGPLCEECPLTQECSYFLNSSNRGG